jgi:hypothetical protein
VTNRARRLEPEPRLVLPDLTGFRGSHLEPRHDYDAVDFVACGFTDQDAGDVRFLESRFQRCAFGGLSLRRARFSGSLLDEVHGATWAGAQFLNDRRGRTKRPNRLACGGHRSTVSAF